MEAIELKEDEKEIKKHRNAITISIKNPITIEVLEEKFYLPEYYQEPKEELDFVKDTESIHNV